jgi:calcium-dependent protein kinase
MSMDEELNEAMVAFIIKKIVEVVFYLHQNDVVHRDLKLNNILFKGDAIEDGIKIIDFGTARHYKKGFKMTARKGTINYCAPEVIQGKYNQRCDIWSIGVICYVLLCGEQPFNGKTTEEITA